jgi:hypothetical protein
MIKLATITKNAEGGGPTNPSLTSASSSNVTQNFQETDIEENPGNNNRLLSFIDSNPVHHVGVVPQEEPTNNYESFEDASLKEFFERPVRIYQGVWSVGVPYLQTLDPWLAYFSTASVKRKLDNYQMMRCNLHVKVSVNGTPFHYSRMMVAYQPLPLVNPSHSPYEFGNKESRILKMSNMTHGMIDPSLSSSLQFDIPYNNVINYTDVSEMTINGGWLGRLYLEDTYPLEAVSSTAAQALSFNMFAWATDVELAIPTNSIVSASKKSKKKGVGNASQGLFARTTTVAKVKQVTTPPAEKHNGLLSSITSAIARSAGELEDVPLIGGVAGMISQGAGLVSSVAAYFGFSRPVILTDAMLVKRMPMSSIAYTEGAETVSKLTFDPKQSLSIDPSLAAMGPEDELSFKMMSDKESLISTVIWDSADALDTPIFWANVIPAYTRRETATGYTKFALSNLAFVSRPFQYWSGSLEFRFQFVCSAYHSGKLRITYEPDGAPYHAENYNTTYSQIVDLEGDRDVSFIVPWAQKSPYKSLDVPWIEQVFIPPAGIYNYNSGTCNGIIYLTVLNQLVSPDALKGITVNIFVKGGPDFEVAVPLTTTNNHEKCAYRALAASGPGNAATIPDQTTELFGEVLSQEDIGNKNAVFFGESISSFRPLLKRYAKTTTRFSDSFLNQFRYSNVKFYNTFYPQPHGYRDHAYTQTAALDPYNYSPTPLFNYISGGFLGVKGGMRYKHNILNPYVLNEINYYRNVPSSLDLEDSVVVTQAYTFNLDGQTINKSFLLADSSTWGGAYVAPGAAQPGIEVEVPYYANFRFSSADQTVMGDYGGINDYVPYSYNVVSVTSGLGFETGTSRDSVGMTTYVAIAEDTTFNYYMGSCPIFIYDTDPV